MINKQAISKRIIGLITAMLIMSIAVPAQEPSITWTGGGTESDPYQVSTAEDLAAFRDAVNSGETYEGKTVILTTDITLSDAWTPIGNKSKQFKGTFEGGGHCINDLNVNINGDGYLYGDSYGGLFGYIGTGGTVQNLGVTGKVSVILPNNDAYAGGIAGRNQGTIKNCFTTVEVEAWGGNSYADSYAGGIAGCNQADISNCYATGEISSALYAGGIAGTNTNYSNDGTISYCYATGKVNNNQYAAGIAYKQASVTHCIALNTKGITSSGTIYRVSSIAGTNNYASPLIDGTWADKGADKPNGADLTDDNFTNVTGANGAFTGWPTEGANDWDFSNNTNLPKLKGFTAAQPADGITRESMMRKPLITTISSAEDLVAFRDAVNNDADYAGKTVTLTADITVTGWTTGIGILTNNQNDNKPFLGIFDGQGHTITLTGSASLFAIIGKNSSTGGTVQNLGVKATITANTSHAGGIVGQSLGTVRNCYTEGAITNESGYAGGIVAHNGGQGIIQNCYSTALCTTVTAAGGIVGYNSGTVQQCYATGAIAGGADGKAGGIAGSFSGSSIVLKNCIALNTGGITAATKKRVAASALLYYTDNFASPAIPGEWTDKGADKADGADLTEANFTNSTAGQGAFINWTTASWDFSDNTRLPKLKTTGLATDRVISGQGDGSGNMPTRADFLELPIEISTAVSYEAATHKDKDIVIKPAGILTIAAADASLQTLTIEEGGQVVAQKAFTVKRLAHPITLGNKWTAYGSPVNMKAVATSQTFYQLNGYSNDKPDAQLWNIRGTDSNTILIQNRYLIATEANNVAATLSAPTSGSALVTIPADAAAPTGEALNTGIFLFHANPTLKEVTIPMAYILSDDGTRFERTENAVVKPFQSYMVANAVTSAAVMELRAGGIPTANEPVALPDNTFRVWAADGQLHLDASKPADISIYNTAGQLVRRLALTGQQTVSLPRGIYFVHSNNITYKVSL